jgi:uncharacterized protein YceH (UPF0502 family)
MNPLLLSASEARVLGSLVEKSLTTPQYYPMTVNALVAAANQKSCRHPVMALTEGGVGAALIRLEELRLCARDDSSARATKWRHQFQHQLLLKPAAVAVLATLMLRGPQTLAELRANASMLGGPDAVEEVNDLLRDLADRAQPLVMPLPRGPGQKEARYVHLLSGAPDPALMTAAAGAETAVAAPADRSSLLLRLEQLEARVTELEQRLADRE